MSVDALQPERWTSNANEALTIYITENGLATPCQPNFTYPIFGDAETIFGYRDLVIYLCFDHCTFLPFLNVKYSAKLDTPDVVDVRLKLMEFLPPLTVYKDEARWLELTEREVELFHIPSAEQVGADFTRGDDTYALHRLDLTAPPGQELHRRLQILVLLFIEAGSYIDISDPLWDVYVLYKVTSRDCPSVVGFTTAYNYWKYPGHLNFDAGRHEVRKKISQFVVLPHYQGKGLGGEMYNRLYEHWLHDPVVVEVVVEDPSEQFDDLRDRQDLVRLHHQLGHPLTVADLTPEWCQQRRAQYKLEKRQFARLLEMLLLHQAAGPEALNSKKSIRLFVKQRLYDKNRETLESLDKPTRLDRLQTAYESLEQDYLRILKPVKFKRRGLADGPEAKKRAQ